MSVYFEGPALIDGGKVTNVVATNNSISSSVITTSTIDMNLENITNVKDPINLQDAATKNYVDNNGIVISDITLSSTTPTLISTSLSGSYVINFKNLILNGPSAVFNITKNDATRIGICNRISAAPGAFSNITLFITWPINSGIYLNKNGSSFDGGYRIKII